MGDEIKIPPIPPPPGLPQPTDRRSWAQRLTTATSFGEALLKIGALVILVGGTVGTAVWTYADKHGVSTDDERQALEVRRKAAFISLQAEHAKLQGESHRRLDALEKRADALENFLIETRRDQVSLIAADREHDRRLKAAAATYYRGEFDRLIRKGHDPTEAKRAALRSQWYDRPRLPPQR